MFCQLFIKVQSLCVCVCVCVCALAYGKETRGKEEEMWKRRGGECWRGKGSERGGDGETKKW